MRKRLSLSAFFTVASAFLIAQVSPAAADAVADFYSGKRITLLISSGV